MLVPGYWIEKGMFFLNPASSIQYHVLSSGNLDINIKTLA